MNKQIELQTLPRSKYLNLKKSIPAIVYGGKSGNDIIEIDAKNEDYDNLGYWEI